MCNVNLVEENKIKKNILFFKNYAGNEAGVLVPDHFLFCKNA